MFVVELYYGIKTVGTVMDLVEFWEQQTKRLFQIGVLYNIMYSSLLKINRKNILCFLGWKARHFEIYTGFVLREDNFLSSYLLLRRCQLYKKLC